MSTTEDLVALAFRVESLSFMFLAGHACAGVYKVTAADVNKYDPHVFGARLNERTGLPPIHVRLHSFFCRCFRRAICGGSNGFHSPN